ncbi:P-loop NTPase fold protein [Pseudomonas sp. W5-01]|uniref:P-loop NTPase fold protein n=1 Tax=Pseudomonas sp. W5-01 TaxID=3097454 RepID=UPI00397BB3AA
MSIAKVEKTLISFGARAASTAIVLKGEWGTGKTYFWDKVVKSHFDSFPRKKYSYISLFGLSSLSDLKRSIFENTVPCSKAGSRTTKDSVIENIKNLDLSDALSGLRKTLSFGKEAKLPLIGSLSGIIDSVQYATISDTIICIDDFERRGNGLISRDVLGLISNLVEFKSCAVVLILNDGSLKKDDEFFAFSEKVFDYEVTFAPSVQESVNLIFSPSGNEHSAVGENAQKLGINNIRILKKIQMFAKILDELLVNKHSKVVQQAHSTLPLAVYALYGGGKCKADIDFILRYQGRMDSYLPSDAEDSAEEKESKRVAEEKSIYLAEYGFGACDEFDAAVINLVRKGYVDDDSLKILVEELEKKIQHDKDVALLAQAWELFHASFLDNEAEVFEAFELAISTALQHFTITDLDAVAWVYFETGRGDKIKPVIDKFFEEVFPKHGIKKRENLFQTPRNEYVLQKLDHYLDSLAITGNLSELVQAAIDGSDLLSAEIRRGISQKTDSEFYEYFSGLDSTEFSGRARMLLKCGELFSHDVQATEDFNAIFIKTYGALLKLSGLSPLNSIRMQKFRNYERIYNDCISDRNSRIERENNGDQ